VSAPCVLVVEDEPLIRDLLVAELADAGYRVIQAADAREVDDACRDDRVDIVFIDIRRPGTAEGMALAERLRERWPQCPIVYAAAAQPPDPIPEAGFLRRPFGMAEALQAIARMVGTPDHMCRLVAASDAMPPAGICSAPHGRLAL
jgi:DNA-binding NtrC family response regulator